MYAADAAAEARAQDLLLIVFVEDPAGNSLSIVLGSDETVLTFTYHHLDPPYLVSKGESELEEPVLTAYGSFRHHTEYPRNWVIPLDVGIAAVHEFVLSSVPPENVEWDDV